MAVALGVWGIVLQPGEKTELAVIKDIRITNAALDAELKDENARTSIKLTFLKATPDIDLEDEVDEDEDDEPEIVTTVLCSLTPGKIEQANLDLILNETDEVEFEVVGKNAIHLIGNYIEQMPPLPGHDSDDEDESDDEDGYDLREVSSDVEVDPAELDIMEDDESGQDDSARFEEIVDGLVAEAAGSKKRARESDVAKADVDIDGDSKLSKKQKKQKKQKTDEAPKTNGDVEDAGKISKEEKKGKKEKEKKEEKSAPLSKADLPKGLAVEDKKVGTGKAAKKGDTVSMRYIGKFPDSNKVFDSNTKGKPFTFRLGVGEVIKGWDQGIIGMKVGGERLLVVPPYLGYGSRKNDGIPANSTLKFECKLLEIKS